MGNSRKKIIEAAEKLILESENPAVRMEDVAEKAGLSKKTIYNHFSGKRELMRSAAEQKIKSLVETMTEIAENNTLTFSGQLECLFDFAEREYSALFPRSSTGAVEETFFSVYLPIIKKENFRLISQMIKKGIDSGCLRGDIDQKILTAMFLNTVEGWGKLKEYGIKAGINDLFNFTRRVFLEGCLTEKGRKEMEEKETGSSE